MSNLLLKAFLQKKNIFFHSKTAKYFIVPFCAVLMTLSLFYFMSILVFTGEPPKFSGDRNLSIAFLLDASIDELELRSRHLLEKPEEEEPPPKRPKMKIQQTELEKPKLASQLPQLDLPDDFQSDSQGAGVSSQGIQDHSASPLFRIKPIYPRRAALQNIEGFVRLKFDITETGQVDNVSVIQASPPKIFNSSAVQALRKWKYKAKIENGKAVRQKNQTMRFKFNLED